MMETTSGGRTLAPFQADFVRRLLQEYRRGAVYLLVGPVGIGKSVALAEAMIRLTSEAKTERLLLLCPAPLVEQWAQRLSSGGIRAVGLEPETYRLLREEIGSTGTLPAGIYVVSVDFAKRPDVRAQLQHTSWDLLVVDEAHMLAGQRQRLVQELLFSGGSALLLSTATPTNALESFGTLAVRFDWYGRVAEHLAAATADGPTAVRTVLTSFTRSAEEHAVLAQVAELAPRLEPFVGKTLLRRAASSLNALELLLIRLVAGEEISAKNIRVCRSILTGLEQITTDAQLLCALDIVRVQATSGGHTVIFTDYVDTGRYIRGAVADIAGGAFLMHGGLAQEERRRLYDAFRSDGGALITTSAASSGTSMGFVECVIHYDVPPSMRAFAQREGRYHRFGRTVSCTAHLIADESDLLGTRALAGQFLNANRLAAPPEPGEIEDDADL